MSDDKDKKGPDEEERTVFLPGDAAPPDAPQDAPAPADQTNDLSDPEPPPVVPEGADGSAEPAPAAPEEPKTVFAPSSGAVEGGAAEEPRTVFAPSPGGTQDTAPATPPPAEAAAAAPPAASGTAGATAAIVPRQAARSIKVGDVLNHIFEVKRFIGRGGMGEVFEGCNVNTEERVAIKVMLPAMAADEKIVGLFRKEARTLTKLQHEAIVSYRVLAQEPQLGVLYIVTEYIEGVDLSEMLEKVANSAEEQAGLLRRLASGLAHAHRLGAIHRDLSPDNVLLPGGDVHEATIIDFGIAKDLNAGAATIVGDGFAGKLNYVAPEQLGDFGRDVGPWTDVYSLGLVMLAVAQGKPVDMSGSLVDAIDKRRKGPDLSAVPRNLRFLLEDMLRPDPKERLRSMDEVLARLGGPEATAPPIPAPTPTSAAPPPPPGGADTLQPRPGSTSPLLILAVIVAALLAAGAAWYTWDTLRWSWGGNEGGNDVVPINKVEPGADPVATARGAIDSVLPSVGCTWLDISGIEGGADGLRIALRGVAGDARAAQRDISEALNRAGVANARLDFGDVAPILPAGCAALDTYRQIRAPSAAHVSVAQPRFETMMQPPGMPYAGEQAANSVINLNFADLGSDFAILGIEPSGEIAPLIADRATFNTALQRSVGGRPITDDGNDRYRLNVDLNHIGWSGIILVVGQGPFEPDLVAPRPGSRGPSWQQQFLRAAADRNWRIEMVWFEAVDRVPGDTAPAPSVAPPAPPPADAPALDSAEDDKPR